MKITLITGFAVMACFAVHSQKDISNDVTPKSNVKEHAVERAPQHSSKRIKSNSYVTVSKRAGEPQKVHNKAYYQEEIDKVDAHIAAIDKKVELISNDPVEKAKAEDNGWFDSMNATKNQLITKKTTLQEKMTLLEE